MPSGSHAGGRSGGGGGFSGGGGGRGGSSRSIRRGPRSVRMYGFFGPRVYVGPSYISRYESISLAMAMVGFFLFMMVFAVIGMSVNIGEKERLYDYYQLMIDLAEENDKFATARVNGYYESNGKYYLTYEFDSTTSLQPYEVDGYTYSVYTLEEAARLYDQRNITIVYDSPKGELSYETDSIPYDYKDTVLTDDADYNSDIFLRNVFGFIVAGLVVAEVALGASMVHHVKKTQRETDRVYSAPTVSRESIDTATATKTEDKPRYCTYCGSMVDKTDKKCSCCGSRIDK